MLEPCGRCHRHVAITDSTCRFCGEPIAPSPPRSSVLATRLSRAAVFAGATLTGCWTSTSPGAAVTPSTQAPAAQARGTIAGTIRVLRTQEPWATSVVLIAADGSRQSTRTDADGNFTFTELRDGAYTLSIKAPYHGNGRVPADEQITRTVTITSDQPEHVDISVDAPRPAQPSPVKMPYGAPPARRRIA